MPDAVLKCPDFACFTTYHSGSRPGGIMYRIAVLASGVSLLVACGAGTVATPGSPSPAPTSASATASASPEPTPIPTSESAPSLTSAECSQIWYDYQYGDVAPGFPTTTPADQVESLYEQCEVHGLLPTWDQSVDLSQRAFNTVAQILEKEIYRVSKKTGTPPCEALFDVLKPVGANGNPLRPGDDVEGYSQDSFLPILRYQWFSGPFRLKFGVGCQEYPWANLWLFAEPYPPKDSHPERYPSDKEVKKDPWPRTAVQAPMSTCITWGPDLGNDGIGGRGYIFSFMWDRTNLPNDVGDCYPKALGLNGLDQFPFDEVPNL